MLPTATADSPYTFKTNDFPFFDRDGDTLTRVTIKSLPSAGTMLVDGSAATQGQNVATADIGTIKYYPAPGQSAQANYASFTFSVTAGGQESGNGTITINLIATEQVPATGSLALFLLHGSDTSALDEDTPLEEDIPLGISGFFSIVDLNTIPSGALTSLKFKWQQSATRGGQFTDITDTSLGNPNFTPLQIHVGTYIRGCVVFLDGHATPNLETVCSAAGQVTNRGDQPVGGPSTVKVPTNAIPTKPHRFARTDFPFSDEDGDTINGIRITAPPTRGTLVVRAGDSSTAIAIGAELTLAQMNALAYYPEPNAPAGAGYATFTYRVRDTGTVSTQVLRCIGTDCSQYAGSTNEADTDSTLTIDLINTIRLRLRVFLEGPLR